MHSVSSYANSQKTYKNNVAEASEYKGYNTHNSHNQHIENLCSGRFGTVWLSWTRKIKVARIAKVICRLEHHFMGEQRNEWYNVIIPAMSPVYNTWVSWVWVGCSTIILLQPLFKDAVNHGMMIDEDWIISRCSHVSHYSFLTVIKVIIELAYS